MAPRLLTDWQLDAILLVWPHAGMAAYHDCLSDLQSFYVQLIRELARTEQVACIVPSANEADRVQTATGLPLDSLMVAEVDDIWVRDFAPLACKGGLVLTRYDPEYADAAHSEQVQAGFMTWLRDRLGADQNCLVSRSALVLEGGNISHDGAGRIVSCEKVLARNGFASVDEAAASLGAVVELDRLALIPMEPDDPIGHADGVVRWLPSGQLAVNDYAALGDPRYKIYWRELMAALKAALGPTDIVAIPYPLPQLGLPSVLDATGNYANFLVTRNWLFLPAYGLPEDEDARTILAETTALEVVSIDATALARQGGVLNCATWCFDAALLALWC